MNVTTVQDLVFDQLRDLLSVERQLTAELPHLIPMATHPGLRHALERHADETLWQLAEVEDVFRQQGVAVGDDECLAMRGLLEGGRRHLMAVADPQVRDLMLIAHCLRIEHYEIAAYEITLSLASGLGFRAEAARLSELLDQEEHAAQVLEDLEPEVFDHATALAVS